MMSYKESLQWKKKEKNFLNTLDLTNFISSGKRIVDIMNEIEDKYGEHYKEESFIFNCMDSYDFMEYLKDRYKINCREVSYYEVM